MKRRNRKPKSQTRVTRSSILIKSSFPVRYAHPIYPRRGNSNRVLCLPRSLPPLPSSHRLPSSFPPLLLLGEWEKKEERGDRLKLTKLSSTGERSHAIQSPHRRWIVVIRSVCFWDPTPRSPLPPPLSSVYRVHYAGLIVDSPFMRNRGNVTSMRARNSLSLVSL